MFSQSVVHWTSQDAVQVHLDPLHIPFSLDVLEEGSGIDAGGTNTVVRCELKSERACHLKLLWRVPCSSLGRLLNVVTAADVLLLHGDTRSFGPGEHSIEAVYQGEETLEEPSLPRSHYPLVAVVEITAAPESPSSVVALVAVIHVRDTHTSMATSVLHRYVRQADGRVTLLQPLYSSAEEGGSEPLGLCSVCQEAPAAVVLLPCRHGCVCRACFARTPTCPLCRGFVAQYFTRSL
ncbi:cell growth regulator with RING finger domain protein 1-like [Pollicipes pollicipes]|uniref:cell growth regulator with RING finger domain protein 1-like n=1 Tax=Pollicipes pollicipes TaxID=41117 RepID=UPI00188567B4|nr:cell growth regulator with RING finger domain protein 1-like [Pollicipes pollicipes]